FLVAAEPCIIAGLACGQIPLCSIFGHRSCRAVEMGDVSELAVAQRYFGQSYVGPIEIWLEGQCLQKTASGMLVFESLEVCLSNPLQKPRLVFGQKCGQTQACPRPAQQSRMIYSP